MRLRDPRNRSANNSAGTCLQTKEAQNQIHTRNWAVRKEEEGIGNLNDIEQRQRLRGQALVS